MDLIGEILRRDEFVRQPIVLLDVGASGDIYPKWRTIAPYSVCVAFDADQREMGVLTNTDGGFKALHVYPAIVTEQPADRLPFYLTAFPYCSSQLAPATEELRNWAFGPLFEVVRTVDLPATTLTKVLAELNLAAVDWIKIDSQGTDLRLFKSLGPALTRRALAAEFEPGFISAYKDDDSIGDVLTHMRGLPFFLSHMNAFPMARIRPDHHARLGKFVRWNLVSATGAPAWAELTFLNTVPDEDPAFGVREWLLAWVFATVQGQHGHAADVARRGAAKFPADSHLPKLAEESLRLLIRHNRAQLPAAVVRRGWGKLTRPFRRPG